MARTKLPGVGRPVRRVEARRGLSVDARAWPYRLAAVATLLHDGVDLGQAPILVGENGSGKSTIVEAVAEAYGLNPEGGSTGARYATRRSESALAGDLQVVRGAGAARGGYFLRAETLHGLFTYLESNAAGDGRFHSLSHAESFKAIFADRSHFPSGAVRPGLYVLDEPEAALSFTSSLQVLAELVDLLRHPGVQVLMATHSPVLSALPGATILQLSDAGLHEVAWADLDLVVNEKYFLADPQRFLRRLE